MAKNPQVSVPKRKNMRISKADMLFFDGMWDDKAQMPKPWVFALVLSMHALAIVGLINSKTLNFKPQKPIPIEIIYEEPKPEPIEPEEVKIEPPKPILYKKPIEKPIEKNEIKPKPFKIEEAILKPNPQKIEENINIEKLKPPPIPKEEIEPKEAPKPKLIDIEKMMRELKPAIKGPDIKADQLGNNVDPSKINSNNPNSSLLNEPKPVKDPGIETKSLDPNSKIQPNINAINNFKLQPPKDYTQPAPISADKSLDAKTKIIGDNSKLLDAKQNKATDKFNKDEIERQKLLDALEKQKNAILPSNNAPVADGGELPKPSGVTAVSPIGAPPAAGNPPSGGQAPLSGPQGTGLPKKPASFGKGTKNLFEEGEDNSAIGKVGRAIDCAKLGQKERSEKCPNWRPLEAGAKKDIAPKPPVGFNPSKPTNQEPLKACPKDHPNGNLGLPCLPQKQQN